MKTIFITLSAFCIFTISLAQNTYVPDDNFEQALINLGYDSGVLDDYVPTANINSITDLDLYGQSISDFTGIEDFIALNTVDFSENTMTTLDISNNLLLSDVTCADNNLLTNLNIKNGNNTNIIWFNASNNPNLSCILVDNPQYCYLQGWEKDTGTSFQEDCSSVNKTYVPGDNFEQYLIDDLRDDVLDNYVVTNNIKFLEDLYISGLNITDLTGISDFDNILDLDCSDNQLTSLDVSQNLKLERLYCNDNSLTNLNVSQGTVLEAIVCSNNQLTNLDVSQTPLLYDLSCDYNLLTNIDISQNANLEYIDCSNNQLSNLDTSSNTNLYGLRCDSNLITNLDISFNSLMNNLRASSNPFLTELNVKNGNNSNFSFFKAINNPNLTCIDVDNVVWSDAIWYNDIDVTASFSENCVPLNITDFQTNNIDFYPNPLQEYATIFLNSNASYQVINLKGTIVKQGCLTTGHNFLNLQKIAKGMYFLKVISKDLIATKKIIKY